MPDKEDYPEPSDSETVAVRTRTGRWRRFFQVVGLLLAGCLILLVLLLWQHARWLPALVNNTLFDQPLAGLSAHSLQLQQARFTLDVSDPKRLNLHSLKLQQLNLTGPANSALTLRDMRWPQPEQLQIDTLNLTLPETSPAALMATADRSSLPSSDQSVTAEPAPPVANQTFTPPDLAEKWPSGLQYDYQKLLAQLAPVLNQLDNLSRNTGLTRVNIRHLQILGLPLNHALELNRQAEGPWLLTLRSRHTESDQRLLDLSLQGKRDPADKTPDVHYRLQLELPQVKRLLALLAPASGGTSSDALDLPQWLLPPQILTDLQTQLAAYRLKLADGAGIWLHSQLGAQQAHLELSLPALNITPIAGCPLTLPEQRLQLSYQAAAGQQPEQLTLALPQPYQLALAGGCMAALPLPSATEQALKNEVAEAVSKPSPEFALKGLNHASLQQGGVLSLHLQQPLQWWPGLRRVRSDALQLGWRPHHRQGPGAAVTLKPVTLTSQAHALVLQTDFSAEAQAELQPNPLFANQSRRLETVFEGRLNSRLNHTDGFEVQRLTLNLPQSRVSLQPAPEDQAVLWAPKQLELPLAEHRGSWQIRYEGQRWQLEHQGQGELLMRHPQLKQNLHLPYRTGITLDQIVRSESAAPAAAYADWQGHLQWQLASPMGWLQNPAQTPQRLLPELGFWLTFADQQANLRINSRAQVAYLADWYRLPANTQITEGELSLKGDLTADAKQLAALAAGGDVIDRLPDLKAQLALNIRTLAGQAKGYAFSGVQLPLTWTQRAGRWQLAETRLTAQRLFAGVELNRLALSLTGTGDSDALLEDPLADDSLQAQLTDFKADTLGGRITLAQLNYPQASGDLKLHGLDLSELIALGEKQIRVSGRLNGTLPLQIRDQGLAIRNGHVFSREGEIVLKDNPAWQAMLQQQPTLAGQLKYLNHLHYHQLQGDISMASDGQLTAVLSIRGENRAEQQPVNLNFTSEQNILTLLKALRLSDQIDKSLSESAQRTFQ